MTAPADLDIDECRKLCEQEFPPDHWAGARQLKAFRAALPLAVAEVERLRVELTEARRITDPAHRWYDADDNDQQAFSDLTNAIANSRQRGPYR